MIVFTVVLAGTILPSSFGSAFDDASILKSVLKEIDGLKIANNVCAEKLAEFDELKNQVKQLQKQNRHLDIKLKELLKEKGTANQFSNGTKDLQTIEKKQYNSPDDTTGKPRDITSLLWSQPYKLAGFSKRQIPADGRVAFTAGLSAGIPNLGPHQTVIFDNAVTNFGNAYHPKSGIFIAPVKGVYVFNVKMKVTPRHRLHLELMVDGNVLFDLGVEIPSSDDYESASELFIAEVNQGADVFVRADANGGVIYGYMRSLFSAFLLFETE